MLDRKEENQDTSMPCPIEVHEPVRLTLPTDTVPHIFLESTDN